MKLFILLYTIYILISTYIILYTLSYNCNTISKNISNTFSEYKTISNKLETGDCIFLSSNTIEGKLIKFWSEFSFTHAGIIVVINNKNYIWECDMTTKYKNKLTNEFNSGCHLISLDDKLEKYRGSYGLIMKYKKQVPNDKILDILKIYKTDNFNKNFLCWWSSYNKYKFPFCESKNDNKFCSELVADTYQKLDIYDKHRKSDMYTIKDLYEECLQKDFYIDKFIKLKNPLYYFLKSWTN